MPCHRLVPSALLLAVLVPLRAPAAVFVVGSGADSLGRPGGGSSSLRVHSTASHRGTLRLRAT